MDNVHPIPDRRRTDNYSQMIKVPRLSARYPKPAIKIVSRKNLSPMQRG